LILYYYCVSTSIFCLTSTCKHLSTSLRINHICQNRSVIRIFVNSIATVPVSFIDKCKFIIFTINFPSPIGFAINLDFLSRMKLSFILFSKKIYLTCCTPIRIGIQIHPRRIKIYIVRIQSSCCLSESNLRHTAGFSHFAAHVVQASVLLDFFCCFLFNSFLGRSLLFTALLCAGFCFGLFGLFLCLFAFRCSFSVVFFCVFLFGSFCGRLSSPFQGFYGFRLNRFAQHLQVKKTGLAPCFLLPGSFCCRIAVRSVSFGACRILFCFRCRGHIVFRFVACLCAGLCFRFEICFGLGFYRGMCFCSSFRLRSAFCFRLVFCLRLCFGFRLCFGLGLGLGFRFRLGLGFRFRLGLGFRFRLGFCFDSFDGHLIAGCCQTVPVNFNDICLDGCIKGGAQEKLHMVICLIQGVLVNILAFGGCNHPNRLCRKLLSAALLLCPGVKRYARL